MEERENMPRPEDDGVIPQVVLDDNLQGRVRTMAVWIDGVEVETTGGAYAELMECARSYQKKYEGKTVGQVDGVAEARQLYRSFGIDPTSTRPSSEALLKRALQGKMLYQLNTVVDTGNLVSLETLLPLGLYDRAAIVGDLVRVREGRSKEEYPGIRKGPVHLEGRLCVADAAGPFGSPTSDSFRTRVTPRTRNVLVVIFAPASASDQRMEEAARRLAEAFSLHARGRLLKTLALIP